MLRIQDLKKIGKILWYMLERPNGIKGAASPACVSVQLLLAPVGLSNRICSRTGGEEPYQPVLINLFPRMIFANLNNFYLNHVYSFVF